ncbi:hypothetical protein ACP179_03350 [Xenorhabdus stockiae]|uniref:hypothetical protein n=1 Tax=Xenorhabdus stockiae TaxID=351614 RepID=UPI003CEE5E0E
MPQHGMTIDFSKIVIPAGGMGEDEKKAAENAALLREGLSRIINEWALTCSSSNLI